MRVPGHDDCKKSSQGSAMKTLRKFQLKLALYGLAWFALLTGVLQG